MSEQDKPLVILASASQSRKMLLENAGLQFETKAANVDESELKHSLQASGANAKDTAVALAELKALRISKEFPNALIIGADQMLECNGVWFDKPADMSHARAHLLSLKGKNHHLQTAVCVAKANTIIWHYTQTATLEMRSFSDEFLDQYLDQAGEEILQSVGAYQLEGLGAQLFNKIEGDFFSILGLPLLPLVDFLRGHKVFKS
ncbi:Maf family protein [Sneathiella limimaris]|uniref:Maf family protein n=1 Tax=Sneathiella limimaris TaxID=1964213 RepID=UPI00146E7CE6|nr:Maf family nucleotide pyrophosphatase [Sneathiella limimaris]